MTHSNCTVTGWGLIQNFPEPQLPINLQVAEVNLYSPLQCQQDFFRNRIGFCGGIMLCAAGENVVLGDVNTCSGDSGGPLQCQRNSDGEFEVVGITSFTFERRCAQPFSPHVYTRVSSFMNFISREHSENTPENFECPDLDLFFSGAVTVVFYSTPICVTADGSDGFVTCSPQSPTILSLPGVVTCTCFDTSGISYTLTCPVEAGRSPPEFGSCPNDIQLIQTPSGQEIISYTTPPCTDEDGGTTTVTCTPPNQSIVESPRHISCTCTDSAANDTIALYCAIDQRLTVIPCPPPIFFVDGVPSWTTPDCVRNGVVVGVSVCSPSSGTLQTGTVTCVCLDGGQQDTCTFDTRTDDLSDGDPCSGNPCGEELECRVTETNRPVGYTCHRLSDRMCPP